MKKKKSIDIKNIKKRCFVKLFIYHIWKSGNNFGMLEINQLKIIDSKEVIPYSFIEIM